MLPAQLARNPQLSVLTLSEEGPIQWRQLRAGIADLRRRAEVSQKALDRFCTALAQVDDTTTLRELTASIEKRVRWQGRPIRALHPFEAGDLELLEAVNRGEFAINGVLTPLTQKVTFSSNA